MSPATAAGPTAGPALAPAAARDAQTLAEFIAGATGSPADEAVDRVLAVFALLRREMTEADWHGSAALRALLRRHAALNPYEPPPVREREVLDRGFHNDIAAAVAGFEAAGGAVVDLDLDVADLAATANCCPQVAARSPSKGAAAPAAVFLKVAEYLLAIETARTLDAGRVVDLTGDEALAHAVTGMVWDATVLRADPRAGSGAGSEARRIETVRGAHHGLGAVPDGSADLIVIGEGVARMVGEQDRILIAEAHRALRPGGMVLVVPLPLASRHSLTVNPLAAFLPKTASPVGAAILAELAAHDARITYDLAMRGAYARQHDGASLMARLGNLGFRPELLRPRFASGHGEGVWRFPVLGLDLPLSLLDGSPLLALRLAKPPQ